MSEGDVLITFKSKTDDAVASVNSLKNAMEGLGTASAKGTSGVRKAAQDLGFLRVELNALSQLGRLEEVASGIQALSEKTAGLKFGSLNSAAKSLGNLSDAVSKTRIDNGKLESAVSAMKSISEASSELKSNIGGGFGKLESLSSAIYSLSGVQGASASIAGGLDTVGSHVSKFGNNVAGLKFGNITSLAKSIRAVADSMLEFAAIGDEAFDVMSMLELLSGIRITKNQFNGLDRLTEIIEKYDGLDLTMFSASIVKMTELLGPFTTKVYELSGALNSLPVSFRTVASAARSVNSANKAMEKGLNSSGNSAREASSKFGILRRSVSKCSDTFGIFSNRLHMSSNGTMGLSTMITGGAMIAGFYELARAVSESVTSINDYVEAMNLAQTVMGQSQFAKMIGTQSGIGYTSDYDISTGQGNGFWTTAQDLLGIDSGEAVKYQAVFEDIITGLGVGRQAAEDMSQQLTQLMYDISSFNNISTEEAAQKVQSGISGELEPMRRIGYDLSVARLQQDASSLGLEGNVSTMTQAEKVALRYYEMITQITEAHGDLARTINSPANQMRTFSSQVQILARNFGAILLPAINAVLPALTAMVKLMQEGIKTLAGVIGVDLSDYFADLSSVDTSSIDGVSDDIDDAADSASGAADAVKEWKNQLLGFDEINNITAPSDSSASGSCSGSGAGGGGGLDLSGLGYDFFDGLAASRVNEMVEKIRSFFGDAFSSGGFYGVGEAIGGQLKSALMRIPWASVEKAAQDSGEKFAQMLNGFFSVDGLGAQIGNSVAQAINTGISSALGFLREFDFSQFGEFLGEGYQTFFSMIDWDGAAEAFYSSVNGFGEVLGGVWSKIDWAGDGSRLGDTVMSAIDGIDFGMVAGNVGRMLSGMFTAGIEFMRSIDAGKLADDAGLAIREFIAGINFEDVGNVLGTVLWKAAEFASELLFDPATWMSILVAGFNLIVGFVRSIFENPKGFIDAVMLLLAAPEKLGVSILENVAKFFPEAAKAVAEGVLGIWVKCEELFNFAHAFINNKFVGPVIKTFDDFASKGGELFSNLSDGIKGAFSGIGEWFENNVFKPIFGVFTDIFNGIADLWNGLAEFFNGNKIETSGGDAYGFSMSSLPRFSAGGFPATGQLFLANEDKPEMVGSIDGRSAVANSNQIVDSVSSGVERANVAVVAAIRELIAVEREAAGRDTYVRIGDVVNGINTMSRRTGRTVIV